MYHIKRDKRAYKSAELICEGLAECLKSKEYMEIGVTDICEKCNVARSTFYRLFDTVDDVLRYQFDSLFEECLEEYVKKKDASYARMLIGFLVKNKALVTNILKSGRSDIFLNATKEKEQKIMDAAEIKLNQTDVIYTTAILNQLAFALLNIWMEQGCRENEEQLYQRLKRELLLIYKEL